MDIEDNKKDIIRNIHNQTSSEIINLQTALYTTITAVFGTSIIGFVLGLKDIIEIKNSVFLFPWSQIIPFCIFSLGTFITAEVTFIFIQCISLGLKKFRIEDNLNINKELSREQENFIPHDQSNFLQRVSTTVYYPSLSASGYAHNYFPPLFILTPVFGIILSSIYYYFLLNSSAIHNGLQIFIIIHNFTHYYPLLSATVFYFLFLLVNWLLVPVFTPNTYKTSHKTENADVLIISETLSHLHGTEVAVVGFAKVCIASNYKICLIGPAEKSGYYVRNYCEDNNIPLCQIPSSKTWFLGQPDYRLANPLLLLFLIHRKIKCIYVNAFPGTLSLFTQLLCKLYKIPIIFVYHVYLTKFCECIPLIGKTRFTKRFFNNFIRSFSGKVDKIIAPSIFVAKELNSLGIDENKICIIPTGVNDFFIQDVDVSLVRNNKKKYGSPILLHVGRLSQEKNLELLIHSFSLLLIKYPNAHLLLVGIGPLLKKLKKLSIKLSVDSNVTFLGYIEWEDLIYIYHVADVFCLTSLGESQGLVIQEAKACGIPCVVLNAAGASEQIENYDDGILVDIDKDFNMTCKGYADSVDLLLSDKILYSKISKNSITNAKSYTIDTSARKFISVMSLIAPGFCPGALNMRGLYPRY